MRMTQTLYTLFALALLAALIAAALLWPLKVIAIALVMITILLWTRK